FLQGPEVRPQGDPRPQEDGGHGGGAEASQGSPEGQPDAVSRVDLEPDAPSRQAGDAPGLLPHHGRDAGRHRGRASRRGPGPRERAPRRGATRAHHPRATRPPEPSARTLTPLNSEGDFVPLPTLVARLCRAPRCLPPFLEEETELW